MQFKVPQDINRADKIVGPLTLLQLIISVIGGSIAYATYSTLIKKGVSFIFWFPPVIVILALTAAFAFLKIANLPFYKYLALVLEKVFTPSQRSWVKGADRVVVLESSLDSGESAEVKQKQEMVEKLKRKQEKIKSLDDIRESLDTEKKRVIEEIKEKGPEDWLSKVNEEVKAEEGVAVKQSAHDKLEEVIAAEGGVDLPVEVVDSGALLGVQSQEAVPDVQENSEMELPPQKKRRRRRKRKSGGEKASELSQQQELVLNESLSPPESPAVQPVPMQEASVPSVEPEPIEEVPVVPVEPEPLVEPEPIAEVPVAPVASEPVVEPEPVVEAEAPVEPESVVEAPVAPVEPESVVEAPVAPVETEPVVEVPVAPLEPEPVVEVPVAPVEPEPVVEVPVEPMEPKPVVEVPVAPVVSELVEEVPATSVVEPEFVVESEPIVEEAPVASVEPELVIEAPVVPVEPESEVSVSPSHERVPMPDSQGFVSVDSNQLQDGHRVL